MNLARRCRHLPGKPLVPFRPGLGVINVVKSVPVGVMGIFQQIRPPQHWAGRYSSFLELPGYVPHIPVCGPFSDDPVQFLLVILAVGIGGVERICSQLRPANSLGQLLPLAVVGGGNRNPTVVTGAGIGVVRRNVGRVIAYSLRLLTANLVGQDLAADKGYCRLLLRNVNEHTPSGAAPVAQSGKQYSGGVGPGDRIAVIDAGLHRPVVSVAGHVSHAGQLLLSYPVGHVILPRPAVAEGGH